jgi:hypothetical protein
MQSRFINKSSSIKFLCALCVLSGDIIEKMKTQPFTIATDGSSDKGAEQQLYPIVVRYFDPDVLKIITVLLKIAVTKEGSTGHNIFGLLDESLSQYGIPWTNAICFASDSAGVMVGKNKGVAAFVKEKNPNIHMQPCVCHLINLAAEKGAAKLEFAIDQLLVDIYFYMDKSSKRHKEFKQIQNLCSVVDHKILKHVSTRWLSLGQSLARALEQWAALTLYFKTESEKEDANKERKRKAEEKKANNIPNKKAKPSTSSIPENKSGTGSKSAGSTTAHKSSSSKLKSGSHSHSTSSKSIVTSSSASNSHSHSSSTKSSSKISGSSSKSHDSGNSSKSHGSGSSSKSHGSGTSSKSHGTGSSSKSHGTGSSSKSHGSDTSSKSHGTVSSSKSGSSTKSQASSSSGSSSSKSHGSSSSGSAEDKDSSKSSAYQAKSRGFNYKNVNKAPQIFSALDSQSTLLYAYFLTYTIPLFDIVNLILQSDEPQVQNMHDCLNEMFVDVITRFVKPDVIDIAQGKDVLSIPYSADVNQKSDENLVVGQQVRSLIAAGGIPEGEIANFYQRVRKYYIAVCDYMLEKFPLNNELLQHAKIANPARRLEGTYASVLFFADRFGFDGNLESLEMEFARFQLEKLESRLLELRVDEAWVEISNLKTASKAPKYPHLCSLMLGILSISHSNADSERIFSSVRKTENYDRGNLKTEKLSELMVTKVHSQAKQKCCFNTKFSDDLLVKCKKAAMHYNRRIEEDRKNFWKAQVQGISPQMDINSQILNFAAPCNEKK